MPSEKLSVVELAVQDDAFRQALLKDARSAIEERFQVKISDSVTIHVHCADKENIHLVLPDLSSIDDELKKVKKQGSDTATEALKLAVGKAIGVIPDIPAGLYEWRVT